MTGQNNDDRGNHQNRPGRIRQFAGNRVRPLKNLTNPVIGMDEDGNEIRSFDTPGGFSRMFLTVRSAFVVIFGWVRGKEPAGEPDHELTQKEIWTRWGLNEENLPKIMRSLRFEQITYAVIALVGLSQVLFGVLSVTEGSFWSVTSRIFLGSIALIAALVMMAQATWRIDVIRQNRYRSFTSWLRGK